MGEEKKSPVLELEEVDKTFGEGEVKTRVLKAIDLQIEGGELTSLVGPSGSGKSTLLNIMGLLDRPTGGTVMVNGIRTTEMDDREITLLRGRTLGFIFQFHHLLTAFSVVENVMLPAALDGGGFTKKMRERAMELLKAVELTDQAEKSARKISGGQQQRVAIARALMMKPDLVLSDEPTGNLDTKTAGVVFDLLRKINAETGTAFLIVTHDRDLAEKCDRHIELVDGKIVADEVSAPAETG